ncbi:hypothetical protein A2697_03415 [Candidatus Curtissbacteria bacterium RIFCSPHIGHO2_01_FULL_41_44]|uniref:Uncharacterized protein n=1 Tax=Candidatus Curtissbacteria bacterium RIFCSPLOWO2_01_FULL_42_50 TaxID=1797730 RepID=A0A1F5H8D0_9BACT|nr:MAG: hypothetical protein A2697_03415 [Candidatus Curtissbacteria bacterium RIFCSPHIGHO2_01_FULL_41_44]OGE00295.1 MAG: hypothetical protein A3B54_03500 [Candidatus Curtissbacteria bacterium RIFCSPLOWO2_01_FULL_42_50]OGE03099.1 MAG: hypothetical protein A3G16_04105 [Candidatus Curtissbacteria bacterium RIFCSPLOWO2_12_FULL_41_16]
MTDVTLEQIKEVLQEELKPINKKLAEHSVKLDSLTLDIIDVRKKTDILPDLYSLIKDNKEKTEEQDERIQRLENAA